MSSQPPPKPPATSNRLPPVPTTDGSTQELSDRETRTRSALLTLLQDTNWPNKLEDAAQKLAQTINNLPDLPRDVTPVKDTVKELISVLGNAHASLKEASDRYGRKQGGFMDGIKHAVPSRRRRKWANTLRTCRADIEKLSTTLRSRLESLAPIGTVEDSEMPSGHQNQPTSTPFDVSHSQEPLESQGTPTTSPGQAMALEHPTGQQASIQGSSPDLPENQENRSRIRDGFLAAAKMTFNAVEVVSGAVPLVGDSIGVAAKVGLAFVNMVETMDQNEDVAQELVSHISTLSVCFEHIKKSDPENGDDLAAQVHKLQGELESIEKKVNGWESSSRFKKAFLASYYAGELRSHQDTVKSSQDKIQLISGLKTLDIVSKLHNIQLRAERQRLLDRLGDGSYGARGNSIEEVVCLPGTRVEILDRIDQWVKDTSTSAERVLWIRGMAGRGKSTIASTVARSWASRGSCAIFHFRRGQNAPDGQFLCALARQLGKGPVPEVKNAILGAVRENEDIAKERLDQQFKTLLVGSLDKLKDCPHPIIIIVDALDECDNFDDAESFVRLIDRHFCLFPINVKFLLTCRPEAPLLEALKPMEWREEDLDSIPVSQVSEDVNMYIQHSFAQIRKKRYQRPLPEDWPPAADVKRMVEMSQALFQWARTAIKYIGERRPVERLQELLQPESTWGQLDYLYHQILSSAFDEAESSPRKQLLSWVLETLVTAPYPVSLETIAFLHTDHRSFNGQVDLVELLRNEVLANLNSLLHIPSSPCEPLRLMHTSIRDLLESQERCKGQEYFVNLIQAHRRLARVSLGIMERDLRKNICKLSDISKANSEVQDAVESHVSNGLRYCCRSWSIHLTTGLPCSETEGPPSSDVLSSFGMVCEMKLLAWLEVMSLIGATNEAFTVAKQVHEWLEQWPPETFSGDLITLWNDTQRFIVSSMEPISFGALHIYASALPHCPMETELWAKYGGQATTRIIHGERQINWPAHIWTSYVQSPVWETKFVLDGTVLACILADGTVQLLDAQTGASVGNRLARVGYKVVFSPDGKVLASASSDGTVRLWDIRTGAQLGGPPPDGKVLASAWSDGTVRLWDARTGAAVVFSPDGKILASVRGDKTVRLWDARTGTQLGDPLTFVESFAFSPDSKVLASASFDKTVRLWDARTGAELGDPGPLTDHTSRITSVVFSPDGKVLASASSDGTIRLWDIRTGAQLGDPLTGHTSWISIVFSPDSMVLASVLDRQAFWSSDKTGRLWDARTGAQLGDPLTFVESFVFSPDSKVLASESSDGTVRLRNARTGAQLCDPLSEPTSQITSVVFSPDSKVLASASRDNTVRLWDARTGAELGDPLTGHTGAIGSVVFSSDGKVLASASEDKTVRLWDARTGAELGDPGPLTDHTSRITSVVFSPDGKVLASVRGDKTVRLWDARTGAQLGDPLTFVESFVFSPDSKVLASASSDGTVRLRKARTGAQLCDPLSGPTSQITSVVFPPNSKVLASTSSDGTTQLWDIRTGAKLGGPLTDHASQITSVVFSPDGKVLASASSDGTIRLWDIQTGAQLGDPLTGHTSRTTSIVFSPDGKVLSSVLEDKTTPWLDKTVRLWDARTGAQLGDPLTSLDSFVFSPDGEVLASLVSERVRVLNRPVVRLWDTRTGAQLGNLLADHTNGITSVVFSPDGKVLASVSWDKTVRLWDARTGAQLGDPLTGHTSKITSVVFSPDGEVLASGSDDATVRLWNARTGAQLGDPLTFVDSFVLSPDNEVLPFMMDEVGWRNTRRAAPLTGYESWITSVFLSPDGAAPTCKSADGTIRSWDTLTYQTSAGLVTISTAHHLSFKSNWILCGSKRLLWLPIHYRPLDQPSTLEILFSHGRLAVVSNGKLSVIAVSKFLTTL